MNDDRIFKKCAWRLIPLMLALYFVNYLDRVNVAFASLTMVRDLNFTGLDYLRHFALPNFFFHITTAYDVLRHNGVPLSKVDYIGGNR